MAIDSITRTIEEALRKAGLDTRSGSARVAMDSVRSALAAARLDRGQPHDAGEVPRAGAAAMADTIDVDARVIEDDARPQPRTAPSDAQGGSFLRRVYVGPAGRRTYRLYVPSAYALEPMPLVVMLHGCKQNPEDFATGTRLNALAEERGFLVAYPAQPSKANGSNCWNWFEPQQQTRSGAEPAILAGIATEIGQTHRVASGQVFVAGLSAGAAMAVILGETHPEVFAAVGAHSGLPSGAAHDVASAFAAMHGHSGGTPAPTRQRSAPAVPTIVFHGDRDATVVPRNGAAIVDRAVAQFEALGHTLTRDAREHPSGGRRSTCIAYATADGRRAVEQWIVHGGAHAWSGGDAAGSFTDPLGPDASREMVRFFLQACREDRRSPPTEQ